MSTALRLGYVTVVAILLCGACVPLPRRTTTIVVAERPAVNGTATEVLQQEMTSKRTFYLVAPDGPGTQQWPFRFNYALVNTNGRRQELTFLTKQDTQADWLLGFPISRGRWIAITLPVQREHHQDTEVTWQVIVFQDKTVLSSRMVTLQLDPSLGGIWIREPYPGSPAWQPLRGGAEYRTRLLRFDPTNECLTFITATGDLLFNPNDGTVRKIN